MKKLLFFATIISVFMAVPTMAALHVDTFDATIYSPTDVTGGGSGWMPAAGGDQW